MTGRNQSLSA
uniref:Uncharacterized protein n=1 Tax=Anguilla anguilla TaxID=7936 RepID=A0A0E9R1W4_ANGAN